MCNRKNWNERNNSSETERKKQWNELNYVNNDRAKEKKRKNKQKDWINGWIIHCGWRGKLERENILKCQKIE